MVDEDEVVAAARRVVGDPSAELVSWSSRALARDGIAETTGGVLVAEGVVRRRRGEQPWSAVLKVVRRPAVGGTDPDDWSYWRREVDVYEGVPDASIEGAMRRPAAHLVVSGADEARLWLERVQDEPRRWGAVHVERAARAAGLAAGHSLTAPVDLGPPFLHSLLAPGGWWATCLDPHAPEGVVRQVCGSSGAWRSASVVRAVDETTRARVLRVWAQRQDLLDVLARLPTVLCHGDLHRRNVLLPPGSRSVVAVDWAFCGPGALGSDVADLVWGTVFHGDADAGELADLEEAGLAAFEAGARGAGWSGGSGLLRLAYLTATALRWALLLPGWISWWLDEGGSGSDLHSVFGRSADQLREDWTALCRQALDRADAAGASLRTGRLP